MPWPMEAEAFADEGDCTRVNGTKSPLLRENLRGHFACVTMAERARVASAHPRPRVARIHKPPRAVPCALPRLPQILYQVLIIFVLDE